MKPLLWGAAISLALGGIVLYLVWQSSWAWETASVMLIPLVLLIFSRTRDTEADHFNDPSGGPWTGP